MSKPEFGHFTDGQLEGSAYFFLGFGSGNEVCFATLCSRRKLFTSLWICVLLSCSFYPSPSAIT